MEPEPEVRLHHELARRDLIPVPTWLADAARDWSTRWQIASPIAASRSRAIWGCRAPPEPRMPICSGVRTEPDLDRAGDPRPRVFVCYAHDSDAHGQKVLSLAQRLREAGIEAWVDHFDPAPAQGRPRWLADEVRRADFVVVVCSPGLLRSFEAQGERDAAFVGNLVMQQLLDGSTDHERLVPVVFDEHGDDHIPAVLRSATRHRWPAEHEQLCRRLTRQLAIAPVPVAEVDARPSSRDSYLARASRFLARRRPLRGMLQETGGPLAQLEMRGVEVDVLVFPHSEAFSDEDDGASSLLGVLDRRLRAGERPYLSVVGDVGVGKSTLLEQTFSSLVERASSDPRAALPVLVSAEDLPREPAQHQARYCDLSRAAFADLLRDRPRIVLVDGYDELGSELRPSVDASLDELRDDPRTVAIVICSRPSPAPLGLPPRDRFRVAGWTDTEIERFVSSWSQRVPTAQSLDAGAVADLQLLANPLTATFYLAYATPESSGPVSRAGLFSMVVTQLFDGWAELRSPGKPGVWAEVGERFEQLAYELLSTGRSAFESGRLWQVLELLEPRTMRRWEARARELGLLHQRPDGRYEFPLKPIAEHLAGAYLLKWRPRQVAKIAAAAWAREPVRHCLGLVDRSERTEDMLECLAFLCEPPRTELETVDSLSRLSVAVHSAIDVGPASDLAADAITERIVNHLFDGSSNWRPARTHALVRAILQRGSVRLASTVRERIEEWLETGSDADALTHVAPELRDFYHRSAAVRLAAVRKLASRVDEPEVRLLLRAMLFDSAADTMPYTVAVAAALALRGATRDEAFARFILPTLHEILTWQQQRSGVAACALGADEAEPSILVSTLVSLSQAQAIPAEVVDDLRRSHGDIPDLDDTRIQSSGRDWVEPHLARQLDGERPHVSAHIRNIAVRALGPNPSDARWVSELVARARSGGAAELEVLCELANTDAEPLTRLLREATVGADAWPSTNSIRLFFTPACVPHLRRAMQRNPALLLAMLELWESTRGARAVWITNYPGQTLEPHVADNLDVARVYAEWLESSYTGWGRSPTVPEELRAHPLVTAAIARVVANIRTQAFEGTVRQDGQLARLWEGTAGEIFAATRSFWLTDEVTISAILTWVRGESPTDVVAAMRAFGPRDFPRSDFDVVSRWACREPDSPFHNSVHAIQLQISAILFCAEIGLVDSVGDRLRELAQGSTSVRFAAAAALALANIDDAPALSSRLAREWPDRNWSFWYHGVDAVLPALIRAAPRAWADRAAELGTDALELTRVLVDHLPRDLQQALLTKVVATAEAWALPWLTLLGRPMSSDRLLDVALEISYDAGFDTASLRP